jgi:hypothetical protein
MSKRIHKEYVPFVYAIRLPTPSYLKGTACCFCKSMNHTAINCHLVIQELAKS